MISLSDQNCSLTFARYQYIDAILDAAISSSPHTTPSKTFLDHHTKWNHLVERKPFTVPKDTIDHLPPDWEKYLEECSDEECEAWVVVRSDSPSCSNVEVTKLFCP